MNNRRPLNKKRFLLFTLCLLVVISLMLVVEWLVVSGLFSDPLLIFSALAIISGAVVGVVSGRQFRPWLYS